MAAPLIPALDCDRREPFRAALEVGVVPGGAIHQVGGRDRNIYCRVIEGNQKPEAIRLPSTCLPIRSMAAEQTAERAGRCWVDAVAKAPPAHACAYSH